MPEPHSGAQRASSRRIRSLLTGILAALIVVTALTASAPDAQAANKKVVIVVGPVGSATTKYKDSARALADQARSYGANVVTVFSPNATWARVKDAAVGSEAVLLGRQGAEQVTADELAGIAGTINYEIFTQVSARVPRVFAE